MTNAIDQAVAAAVANAKAESEADFSAAQAPAGRAPAKPLSIEKVNILSDTNKNYTLRPYQVDDLIFHINNPRSMNLSDPSTGKTPPVCCYIQYLWEYQNTKTAWVMPKSLMRKNKAELLRFTDFQDDDIAILDGQPKKIEELINNPKIKVFILTADRFGKIWQRLGVNAMICDEFHMYYKGNDSQRTQNMYAAMKKIKYFLVMTGTLIDGRLDSAYPAIHVIEPRHYPSHKAFLNYHAVYDLLTGKIVGWTNHDKLGRIFMKHAVRHTIKEVYGDQKFYIIKELCDMSAKQRKAYKEFEEQGIIELEEAFITGLAGANVMRCRQIMAHPEKITIKREDKPPVAYCITDETPGKDARLLIHLEDHLNKKEPLLIFAALVPEQERIVKLCKSAGLRTGLINGSVSGPKRGELDQTFQNDELDVLVASPATASVGFNWNHVNHVIFVSLDYMASNFRQAYQRALRGIKDTPLQITVLEYEDSMDQRIFEIVHRKSADVHKIDESYGVLEISA